MALVTRLSTTISNYEAQPRILTSGYISGGNDTVCVSQVAAVSTDSIGSIYRFGFVPSGVRLQDLQIMNDATTAGVWQIGVYLNDNQSLNCGLSLNTWSSTTAYVPGNVVQLAGVVYYCTTGNTNSQPPSGNWTTGLSTVTPAGAIPNVNGMVIFASGVSTAAAKSIWTSVFFPSIGAVGGGAANTSLRVWELLGFSQDPFYDFHIAMTATTAPTANGNIAMQYSWVR